MLNHKILLDVLSCVHEHMIYIQCQFVIKFNPVGVFEIGNECNDD